jgi:hypothetical protein
VRPGKRYQTRLQASVSLLVRLQHAVTKEPFNRGAGYLTRRRHGPSTTVTSALTLILAAPQVARDRLNGTGLPVFRRCMLARP